MMVWVVEGREEVLLEGLLRPESRHVAILVITWIPKSMYPERDYIGASGQSHECLGFVWSC